MLAFIAPGRPVTWQRTNAVRGRYVTDAKQRAEKRRLRQLARAALPPGWPLDAEYAIEVIGYWPDRRYGDADRLVSLAMDALEGVAYRVDRQVCAQSSVRRLDRERPRVEVCVGVVGPGEGVSVELTIGGAA